MATFEEQLELEVTKELLEQSGQDSPIDILAECLPYQLDFIRDTSDRKVVCSERRAGKSFMLALYIISICIAQPKSKCVYLSLTNEQCRQIMWADIFETIFYKYGIKADINAKHQILFANGSIIHLAGLDATPKQMQRLRGQAFDLAVIDEAQDFTQDLKQLIQSVLKMTLAQRQATLVMAGTPGNKQGLHYWYQICKENSNEIGWSRYRFHWTENTKTDPKSGLRICDAIQAMVDKDIAEDPLIVNTPEFRQEILGEWVIETSARIYRYEPIANDVYKMPTLDWYKGAKYILSFDIGYSPDPSTLIVQGWNPTVDNCYYVLSAEKHLAMVTEKLAARIKELDKQYKFQAMVGDSQNANIIADLNQTYGLNTIKADKPGKEAHMNMLNSDFITQKVKLYKPGCPGLSEQLQEVIWDRKQLLLGKRKEDPKFHNDLTDALLYGHHYSRHHWYKAPKPKIPFPNNMQMYNNITKRLMKRNKPATLLNANIDWAEPNK